ncbi:polysaccharide lyase family 14 protein [Mycena maculata]|uniref:Polysaccharide lyase family 14 protein n=1 Tax=Mycena maculata TaxID=230809 RepID=A0AAD7JGY8_9AGAR|nr:polysaccharide lyase family 14 protein [Mycena maculata]
MRAQSTLSPASVGAPLPAPTATNGTGSGNGTGATGTSNGLDALFPLPNAASKWTTFSGAPGALPLSDATLKPAKVEKGMTHNYTMAYGKQAMEAFYPKGSYIPSKKPLGGFSFYAPGPDSVNISTASELTFGYSVYFPQGFDFVKGGKLPGIYGGDSKENSTTCSGGRRDPTCFSARLMWRPEGAGEFYTYLPDSTEGSQFAPNEAICKIANSTCNPTYGASIGRGAFRFQTGQWTTVTERVKLNTFGPSGELQADGALELFANGESVINATNIILRNSPQGRMWGMQMQTFFGGATSEWASPSDQEVYFADFSVAIISTL